MKIFEVISLNEVGVEPIPGMIGQYRVIYPPEYNKTPDGPLSKAAADKKFADAELEFRNKRAQSYIDRKDSERSQQQSQRGRRRSGATTDADSPTTRSSAASDAEKDLSKGLTPKDKASLWQKSKNFLHAGGKAGAGKLGGTLIALLLTSKNLYDEFMTLVDQYVKSGCNRDKYVRHAEQNIRIALVEGVRDLLGGALGGVGATAAALAFIPGLGWLASVGVGVLGGIAGMVLAKLAADDKVVLSIANWVKDNLIKDMTGLIDVFDESLTELGYDVKSCRESAQNRPLPDFLNEDVPVYEEMTDQKMKQIGLAMRKEIVSDPKIKRAVKRIKARQE
jgi:hypothetical protein